MLRYVPKSQGDPETHQNERRRRAGPFGALQRVFNTFSHTCGTKLHARERLVNRKSCQHTYQKTPKGGARREHFFQEISCVGAAPRLAEQHNRSRGRQEGRRTNSEKQLGFKLRTKKPHLWERTDTQGRRAGAGVQSPMRPWPGPKWGCNFWSE